MWIHLVILLLLVFLAAAVKTGLLHIEGITEGQGWRLFLLVAVLGNLLGAALTLSGGFTRKEAANRLARSEESSYEKKFEVILDGEETMSISVQIPEKEGSEDTDEWSEIQAPSSEKRRQQQELLDEIARYNLEKNDSDYYYLPEEWNGKKLEWTSPIDHTGSLIAALSLFAAAVLLVQKSREEQQLRAKREEELLLDYPGMVMKFTLLVQAGMPVRGTFQKMASDYLNKQKTGKRLQKRSAAYEEIAATCYEMESGVSEMEAYRRFGERCGQIRYKTFATLLIQNLQKGSRRMAQMLEEESLEAWEERKRKARVLGEAASTKLLLPMVLMLLVVMALVMIPAFLSFYG